MKIFKTTGLAMLVILLVTACKPKQMIQHLADADVSYLRLTEEIQKDSEIEALIAPYREKMAAEMDVVIGKTDQELVKTKPNSNMGNWFTDLLEDSAKEIFTTTGVDFALQNYGGFRLGSIPAGDITKGKIFELMPFDNTLVNVELDRNTLQQLLDRMADYGGWPISKSLEFTIQDSTAVNVLINNKPLEDRNYYVAMPDYVANGGSDCFFLKDLNKEDSGVYIRAVIIEQLEKLMASGDGIVIDPKERIKTKM